MKSPGKSGSTFYFSSDQNFVIKIIPNRDVEFLSGFMQNYYQYVIQNPHTFLCKLFGLHMVKIGNEKEFYFFVMPNGTPPSFDIHEIYDLKGSTAGRTINSDKKELDIDVLKDLDIRRTLILGKKRKKILMDQIEKDSKLLSDNNLMDYSFLIGIHCGYDKNAKKSNLIDLSENPNDDPEESSPTKFRKPLPKLTNEDGGLESELGDELYFCTIIDFFQTWTVKKMVENSLKSLVIDSKTLSAVAPNQYRERFLVFIAEIVQ